MNLAIFDTLLIIHKCSLIKTLSWRFSLVKLVRWAFKLLLCLANITSHDFSPENKIGCNKKAIVAPKMISYSDVQSVSTP